MTKREMVDYIETTGLVIDFDRNFLMKKSKAELEKLFLRCKKHSQSLTDEN